MAEIDRVLLRRIASKAAQLTAARPYPPEYAQKLDDVVAVSMTYHSNAIEGSMMQLHEVGLALAGDPIPGSNTAEEIAETIGHAQAWRRMQEDAATNQPLRAAFIYVLGHGLSR